MSAASPALTTSDESVHASMIPSACPDDSLAAHNRTDPYWSRQWAVGSTAHWTTQDMSRHRRDRGAKRNKSRLLLDEEKALAVLTANRGRAERLAAWGILDSWRTVSAEQMAAIAGSALLLDPNYSQLAASYALNALNIGILINNDDPNRGWDRRSFYRPASSEAFDRLITPTLTWPEWISATGGYPWSGGGQYDRHNVLATELALRAAEYLPVGTILGEKFSTVDLLAGSGLGKRVKNPDNRRADGTIVRTDGMRIAFELTATASKHFENKVRRWAQVISERPLETSGLTILFIAAPHHDRTGHADPRHAIYKAIAKVLREFPGTGPDSPAARIGVAHWQQYFPAAHEMTEAFFTLQADFATGSGSGPARWIPRQLLGGYAFEPWHTFDATAVLDNAKLLTATPYWLRTGDHTGLIGSPMDRANDTVPHPAPVKPHLVKGRPMGAAVGRGGDAKLPARLRIQGR